MFYSTSAAKTRIISRLTSSRLIIKRTNLHARVTLQAQFACKHTKGQAVVIYLLLMNRSTLEVMGSRLWYN